MTKLETWQKYEGAWAPISVEERRELLRASVTEDCVFTNMLAEGKGFEAGGAHR